jgi:hypothetical protein
VAFGSVESRKALMTMIVLVVVLDAMVIAIYYALAISQRSPQVQTAFVGVWVLATLAIVVVYIKRIRQLRDAAMGRRRTVRP